jgi:hypothetical protein
LLPAWRTDVPLLVPARGGCFGVCGTPPRKPVGDEKRRALRFVREWKVWNAEFVQMNIVQIEGNARAFQAKPNNKWSVPSIP